MFISIDYRSRKPIYEQLVCKIKEMAVSGALEPGYKLPAVRQLASELAINPNTIQKAYAELERQNIIYSFAGKGSFISEQLSDVQSERKKEILAEITRLSVEASNIGMECAELTVAVEKAYGVIEKERSDEND